MGKPPSQSELPINFTGAFSLSITQALGEQLLVALGKLTKAPLTEENLSTVDRRGGIYQLFLDAESVYIGKSKDRLNSRVANHYRKLAGRTPGLLDRMKFKVMYVNEDLDALAPEKMLIRTLKQSGDAPWNQNGFGNKDPGRQRDTSLVKEAHFDRLFPVNLNLPITVVYPKPLDTLLDAMTAIKLALPYNLRFASPKDPAHRELKTVDVSAEPIMGQTKTTLEWLQWLATKLPAGWMITVFPGYIIIYKENNPGRYGSREEVWLSNGDGSYTHETHDPDFAEGEVEVMENDEDNDSDEDEDEDEG
jgi:hypothetical protein